MIILLLAKCSDIYIYILVYILYIVYIYIYSDIYCILYTTHIKIVVHLLTFALRQVAVFIIYELKCFFFCIIFEFSYCFGFTIFIDRQLKWPTNGFALLLHMLCINRHNAYTYIYVITLLWTAHLCMRRHPDSRLVRRQAHNMLQSNTTKLPPALPSPS